MLKRAYVPWQFETARDHPVDFSVDMSVDCHVPDCNSDELARPIAVTTEMARLYAHP